MTPRGYPNPYRGDPEGLRLTRHQWMQDAACKGVGPDIFFDNDARALTYCHRCPVAQDCADYARANNESGVWGGLTDLQRRKRNQYTPPEPPKPAGDNAIVVHVLELHRGGMAWTAISKLTGVHYRNVARILSRRAPK